MSRIAPITPEPVEIATRRKLSAAVRATLAALYEGHCAMTGEPLVDGFHVDHIIALELGGKDELANYQPLNPEAHKIKTRADVKAIAKAKRIVRDSDPETRKRSKRPIRSRPFPKRQAPS